VIVDNRQGVMKSSCTIEVRGLQKLTQNDTIELYFESKRAAGVPVDTEKLHVQNEHGQKVILITYSCEEGNIKMNFTYIVKMFQGKLIICIYQMQLCQI